MKFSIEDLFSISDQIHGFQRIWSHLLKKYSMENFIFLCSVLIFYPTFIRHSRADFHCVKICPYSELFCSVFSRILTEYGEIHHISPDSVQMRENTDQNNSEYGQFWRIIFLSFDNKINVHIYNNDRVCNFE